LKSFKKRKESEEYEIFKMRKESEELNDLNKENK